MDKEKVTPQIVAAQLAKEKTVAYRIAFEKQEDTWRLHTLIMDAFPNQSYEDIPIFAYEYEDAAFLAGIISGTEATTWLTTLEISLSGVGPHARDYTVEIPALQEHVNWQRYPGYAQYDKGRVIWPHARYELYWPNRNIYVKQSEFLVSDEYPFFPSFETALFDLIYRDADWTQHSRMSASESFIIRIARPDSWLKNIHISSTALTVSVAGTETVGTFLEVRGPSSLHFKQRIEAEGSIVYQLTAELPSEWWVVLSRRGQCLDYYHHMPRWLSFSGGQPNVTADPPDLAAKVQEWVTSGEGQTIEFKQEISDSCKQRFLQTVAAFANENGGVILIGVPDNNPSIVGFTGDVDKEKLRLTNTIRDNLTAMPPVHPEHCEVEGKKVIVITVDPGEAVPYGIKPASPTGHPHYYVRHGASNYIAQPHQINAAVRQRMPVAPPSPLGY